MSAGDPVWLILHVPKTGGTTINAHLGRHLDFDETFFLMERWGIVYREEHGRLSLAERSAEARARVRCVAGHRVDFRTRGLFPGREPRFVVVLRDPADRIVSRYNFDRSRGGTALSFEAWYAEHYRPRHADYQVRFLAERLWGMPLPKPTPELLPFATTLLDRCWFVGLTRHLDTDLPHLFRAIGVPAAWRDFRVAGGASLEGLPHHPRRGEVVERFVTVDDDLRVRLHADNPAEVELVRYAERCRARAPWVRGPERRSR